MSFTPCTGESASGLRRPHDANFIERNSETMKSRLDKLLVDRGLAPSRERAQSMILAGKVLANEQKVVKAGAPVDVDALLRILGEQQRYVSRGGLKLEGALNHWSINVSGMACLDVGASTGGFTDCLLQHGASRVLAVDTGYGQMDLKIRNDPRVRLLEKQNARYLKQEDVLQEIDFFVMDVSFISATLVLPAVIGASFPGNRIGKRGIVLVKPQFEAGRKHVGKGGIVRDEDAQSAAVARVRDKLLDLGAMRTDCVESPILGGEGNREFLLFSEW
jgi:23S rRNA (cytidine1920-2'-O)/16S rRNA (cytidine1409-2'-O)-methyltransferase